MLKTIQAGSLRSAHVNQVVTLAGWVDRRRDHGNLIFIDLRDSSGITQINILIGTIIASFQSGAISYLYYADRVYQMNHVYRQICLFN